MLERARFDRELGSLEEPVSQDEVKSFALVGEHQSLVVVNASGMVCKWALGSATFGAEPCLKGGSPMERVAVDRKGTTIAAGSDDAVLVWRLSGAGDQNPVKLRLNERLKGEGDKVSALAVSADGRKVVAGTDTGHIFIWDLSRAEGMLSAVGRRAHDAEVTAIAFLGDTNDFVTGSGDGSIYFGTGKLSEWAGDPGDLASIETLLHFRKARIGGTVTKLVPSPKGDSLVALSADPKAPARLYNIAAWREGLDVGPFGQILGSLRNLILLGDPNMHLEGITRGIPLGDVDGGPDQTVEAAFEKDGDVVVTCTLSGLVRMFKVRQRDVLTEAQEVLWTSSKASGNSAARSEAWGPR